MVAYEPDITRVKSITFKPANGADILIPPNGYFNVNDYKYCQIPNPELPGNFLSQVGFDNGSLI